MTKYKFNEDRTELTIETPFGTRWRFKKPAMPNSGLIVYAANAESEEWDVSAGFGVQHAQALRDFLVELFGPGEGYVEEQPEPEPEPAPERTVQDVLNELPMGSVIKFDLDFRARYARTQKGWKDLNDGIPLSGWLLAEPAYDWPFEVKYNPEED
jgi:hypothetical protein